jgi:hypothetical protein
MIKTAVRRLARGLGLDLQRCQFSWRGEPVRGFPGEAAPADMAIARRVEDFTGTTLPRVLGLIKAVRYVCRYRIPGALVECGVWRGGSAMAMALTLLDEGQSTRDLYLFDTFEGMSEPTDEDRSAGGATAKELLAKEYEYYACRSPLDEVRANFAGAGYPVAKTHFVKGKVEDTVPYTGLDQIALLRLDTDWYESTRHELLHLYPLLSPHGPMIVDDYGAWLGARKAVDEFLAARPEEPLFLNALDETGRIAIKPALAPRPA